MRLLPPREHRGALLLVWAYKAASALVLAYPVSRVLVDVGVSRFPEGDRLLFAPGGMHLLETLRLGRSLLAGSVSAALVLGACAAFGGIVPLAYLMVSLSGDAAARPAERAARTLSALPAFAFLSGATVLAQAALGIVTMLVAAGAQRTTLGTLDERASDLVAALVVLGGLLAISAAGVLEDLARAEAVTSRCSGLRAFGPALAVFLRAPGRVFFEWGLRGLLVVGLVVLGGWGVTALHVERSGDFRVALAWLLHQGVIFGWVLLRASWLARALRFSSLSSRRAPPPDDIAERIAAPGDPIPRPGA